MKLIEYSHLYDLVADTYYHVYKMLPRFRVQPLEVFLADVFL